MFERVFITGASGFIGSELSGLYSKQNCQLFSGCLNNNPSFGQALRFDITDYQQVKKAVEQAKPDLIIHCAYDKSPASRDEVIVAGTKNLVDAVNDIAGNCRFIFLSSEWVFDGSAGPYSEDDIPNPQTGYGIAKLSAEKIVSQNLKNFAIVRTGLVGCEDPPAPRWLVEEKKLCAGERVVFYDNEIRNPIHVNDLSRAIVMLADSGQGGIWHIAGPEYLSRFQELELYVNYRGLDKSLIASSHSDGNNRPLDCSIKIDKFLNSFNMKIRSPREYYR